jgi:hypothetical protein
MLSLTATTYIVLFNAIMAGEVACVRNDPECSNY